MEQDQLSNLPKIILHDIISRLPEEDAVRTSVLSKTWAQTWYTFPILSFCDMKFVGRRLHYLVNSSNITPFLDNVGRTLLRFHNQDIAIKQFKLSVRSFDLYHVSKYVDLWLKLAIESGTEVLELHRSRCRCSQRYILPTGIFEAKSLTKLVLMGRIQVDLSFMNHSMKFFSLQVLKLESVCLGDEHALMHFISCCPLIEYITLSECGFPDDKGYLLDFESLSMCGLLKLKGFDVDGIQEVYVDCPRLENLSYSPSSNPSEKIEMIDFSKCKNLRELCIQSLRSTIITNEWFYKLFPNFPFLESLKLGHCTMSKRIVISSVQLKMLELSSCFDLKEVTIDAPNLLSCKFCDRRCALKSISFLRCSSQLKDVWIYIYNIDFCNFREFIQNFTPKIALALVTLSIRPPTDALNPVLFQVSSLPPNIKDLVLRDVPKNEAMHLPIVYELLSSCCPTTISIYTSFHGLTESCRSFMEVCHCLLCFFNFRLCFQQEILIYFDSSPIEGEKSLSCVLILCLDMLQLCINIRFKYMLPSTNIPIIHLPPCKNKTLKKDLANINCLRLPPAVRLC